jgi:hypothetical protein
MGFRTGSSALLRGSTNTEEVMKLIALYDPSPANFLRRNLSPFEQMKRSSLAHAEFSRNGFSAPNQLKGWFCPLAPVRRIASIGRFQTRNRLQWLLLTRE